VKKNQKKPKGGMHPEVYPRHLAIMCT